MAVTWEHVDFFSIYQWLSGAIVRVGLSVFLAGRYAADSVKLEGLAP
ncbi:hypothetical protein [Cohnella faecalis]|nr:hypothetical protein [Cohnella faecalis]